MNTLFIICAAIASLAVLGVMGLGILALAKGGEFNKKHGNKLMRLRVSLQGLALAMLALAYFSSQG